jgi:hypothetical protein
MSWRRVCIECGFGQENSGPRAAATFLINEECGPTLNLRPVKVRVATKKVNSILIPKQRVLVI